MKISCIMPSYLGNYPGAAKDRESKWLRAVDSFRRQNYKDKELIVVSDGCERTIELCKKYNLQIFSLKKQKPFSGEMRNFGIKYAKGQIITYLDTDDYYEQGHLESIVYNGFLHASKRGFAFDRGNDWVYWDDYVLAPNYMKVKRTTEIKFAKIGTSCIAHKKNSLLWVDGYGHDYNFIQQLNSPKLNSEKIETAGYVVCHINGITDV